MIGPGLRRSTRRVRARPREDVAAKLFDRVEQTTGIVPFGRFVEQSSNAELIHLPVHASWLNQAELFFSIVQRKALTPNDFGPLLARRLIDFGQHYRTIVRPCERVARGWGVILAGMRPRSWRVLAP